MKRALKVSNMKRYQRRRVQRNITAKREQQTPHVAMRERMKMLRMFSGTLGVLPFVAAHLAPGVFW